MDRIEVSTVIHLPPPEVFEFIVDFPRYANYSEHLKSVRSDGDGSAGTKYALRFAWWKVTYTAHTEVTNIDPPAQVNWEVIEDIDAHGHWHVEEAPDAAPADVDTASRVTLRIEFDASSASVGDIGLPSLVSLSWVIEKVKPLIQDEAERIVERIVADLEGQQRPVELTIHAKPNSV